MSAIVCILGAGIVKTIKQLADEIGVSKQAVWQRMKREPLSTSLRQLTTTKGKAVYVKAEGESLIKQAFQDAPSIKPSSVDDKQPSTLDAELVAILRDELRLKNDQIKSQSRQLEQAHQSIQELTAALSRQQYLHAGTIHKQLTDGAEQEEADTPGPADLADPQHSPEEQPKKRLGVFARIFGNK